MEPKQTVNVRLCAEYINHVKVQIDITKISSSTSYCITSWYMSSCDNDSENDT